MTDAAAPGTGRVDGRAWPPQFGVANPPLRPPAREVVPAVREAVSARTLPHEVDDTGSTRPAR